MTARQKPMILASAVAVALFALLGSLVVTSYVDNRARTDRQLLDITTANRANGDLLVDCVTPGPRTPTPDDPTTGHPCWDRLRDPRPMDDLAARITDNGNCDRRRLAAGLPAVPDLRRPCRDQTDPSVYPGGTP